MRLQNPFDKKELKDFTSIGLAYIVGAFVYSILYFDSKWIIPLIVGILFFIAIWLSFYNVFLLFYFRVVWNILQKPLAIFKPKREIPLHWLIVKAFHHFIGAGIFYITMCNFFEGLVGIRI